MATIELPKLKLYQTVDDAPVLSLVRYASPDATGKHVTALRCVGSFQNREAPTLVTVLGDQAGELINPHAADIDVGPLLDVTAAYGLRLELMDASNVATRQRAFGCVWAHRIAEEVIPLLEIAPTPDKMARCIRLAGQNRGGLRGVPPSAMFLGVLRIEERQE